MLLFIFFGIANSKAQTVDQVFQAMMGFQKEGFAIQQKCKEMTRECDKRVQDFKKERNGYFTKIIGTSIQFECVVRTSDDSRINCDHANGSIAISSISSKCSGRSVMLDAYRGEIKTCFTGKLFPKDTIRVEAKIASFSDCFGIVAERYEEETPSCDRIKTPFIRVGGYFSGDLGAVVIALK